MFIIDVFTENKPVGEEYEDNLNENDYISALEFLNSVYYYEIIPIYLRSYYGF